MDGQNTDQYAGTQEVKEAVRKYTYEDYINRPDDERYEIIDGVIYMMSTPLRIHQKIIMNLLSYFVNFLDDKPCEVYCAPFSVRLNPNTGDDTVVEPDIVVICDLSKLDDRGCNGAPDLVIEILSPSTSWYDRGRKLKKYFQVGVRECWIVDPVDKLVAVHILKDGEYIHRPYDIDDIVPVHVLDGCAIDLKKVFTE